MRRWQAFLVCLGFSLQAHAQTMPPMPGWAEVAALLQERCVFCHSGEDAPLGLRLDSHEAVLAGSENGPVVLAGQPAASPLMRRLRGEIAPRMPLDGPPFLSDAQIALVGGWIAAGMPGGGEAAAPEAPPRRRPAPGEDVLFADIRPILFKRCIKCHSDNSRLDAPPEGLRLDSIANVLAGGERLAVLPGRPEMSELWRRVAGLARPRMPLDGPPWLDEDDIRLIGDWIAQGARDDAGRPAPVPAGRRLRLRGILTGPDEIDGARFRTGPGTRIRKPPRIGGAAEMRGVVQPDGSVLATRLRRR